jgi:hypothetical protein
MNVGDAGHTSKDTKDKIINLLERRKAKLAGEPQPIVEKDIPLPDYIRPPDLHDMTDEQLDLLLDLLRLRRLTSTMIYERTMQEKDELRVSRAKEMLDNKCTQVFNELERTLKNLDKLEMKINEMRALRIQAGLQW